MQTVFPVHLSIAMHQLIDGDPCVLFVQSKNSPCLVIPSGQLMGREQPNKCGLRIINSTFGLGLVNARLRCYLMYVSEAEEKSKVIVYHTLRMYEEECKQIESALAEGDRFLTYRWVSAMKTESLGEEFENDIRRNWKTIRQCVSSNYNRK